MTDHKVPTPIPGSNVRFIAWAGYRCAFLRKKTAGTTGATASRASHRISGLGTVLGSLLSVALSPGQAIKSTTTVSGPVETGFKLDQRPPGPRPLETDENGPSETTLFPKPESQL